MKNGGKKYKSNSCLNSSLRPTPKKKKRKKKKIQNTKMEKVIHFYTWSFTPLLFPPLFSSAFSCVLLLSFIALLYFHLDICASSVISSIFLSFSHSPYFHLLTVMSSSLLSLFPFPHLFVYPILPSPPLSPLLFSPFPSSRHASQCV